MFYGRWLMLFRSLVRWMMDDGRWLMLLLLIEYEVQALLAVEVEFTI